MNTPRRSSSAERLRSSTATTARQLRVVGAPPVHTSQPIRSEHAEIRRRLAEVDATAERFASGHTATGSMRLADVLDFFERELLPHAVSEEAVLYEVADRLAGATSSPRFTDALRQEHRVIEERVGDLVAMADRSPREWMRIAAALIGLVAVVRAHLLAEERVVLDLLDRRMTAEAFELEVHRPMLRWLHARGLRPSRSTAPVE